MPLCLWRSQMLQGRDGGVHIVSPKSRLQAASTLTLHGSVVLLKSDAILSKFGSGDRSRIIQRRSIIGASERKSHESACVRIGSLAGLTAPSCLEHGYLSWRLSLRPDKGTLVHTP